MGCRPVWTEDKDCVSETCKARAEREDGGRTHADQGEAEDRSGEARSHMPHLPQLPGQTSRTEFYGRTQCSFSL